MTSRACALCGQPFEVNRPDSIATACSACRPELQAAGLRRAWASKKKYVWTAAKDEVLRKRYDSHVRGRAGEIARTLGWPAWAIKKRAAALGLGGGWPKDRRDWTAEEEAYLRRAAGKFTLHHMAKKLQRSETVVALKCKRLALSRRPKGLGYTMRHLELCFGVDHHTIERWIRAGWLPNRRRDEWEPNEDPSRRSMCLTDADLRKFILDHPTGFELRRVDQEWFMGLILGWKPNARRLAAKAV